MMWGMEIGKRLAEKRVRDRLLIYGRMLGLYGNSIYAILSEGKQISNTIRKGSLSSAVR